MGNPPEITIQPINQTDCIYNTVVFSAGFIAAGSVTYQWESNDGSGWTSYGAAGNTSISPVLLTVTNIGANGLNQNGDQYRVILSDENGTAISQPATLTVNEISGIYPQNTQTTLCAGGNFSFTASTSGSTPLTYQWLKNNDSVSDGLWNSSTIAGSSTPILTVTNASPLESGSYQVRIVFQVMDGISVGKTCQKTSQLVRNVTVNPLPAANLMSSDVDNMGCMGQSITFTGSDGTGYNFRVNGTSVQNSANNTYHIASITNALAIDVIVTNAAGCAATSIAIYTTVEPYPDPNPIINDE